MKGPFHKDQSKLHLTKTKFTNNDQMKRKNKEELKC